MGGQMKRLKDRKTEGLKVKTGVRQDPAETAVAGRWLGGGGAEGAAFHLFHFFTRAGYAGTEAGSSNQTDGTGLVNRSALKGSRSDSPLRYASGRTRGAPSPRCALRQPWSIFLDVFLGRWHRLVWGGPLALRRHELANGAGRWDFHLFHLFQPFMRLGAARLRPYKGMPGRRRFRCFTYFGD